jgi:hypothetical protein
MTEGTGQDQHGGTEYTGIHGAPIGAALCAAWWIRDLQIQASPS